jgi:hypothetical protein
MAPIKRGPIWAIERMNPPAPAIAPNKGIPVKLEARRKRMIAKKIPGRKTAIIADPTPPAFLPPTIPAMSGPMTGNQKSSTEIMNIHTIALPMLPFLSLVIVRSPYDLLTLQLRKKTKTLKRG